MPVKLLVMQEIAHEVCIEIWVEVAIRTDRLIAMQSRTVEVLQPDIDICTVCCKERS